MGESAVRLAASALREDLLDLIDPQNYRRQCLRERGGLAEVSLCFADVLVVQPAGIELQKRKLPLPGDKFCSKRLTAPLDAHKKDALGRFEVQIARRGRESDLCGVEPRFEPLESAKLEAVALDRKKLEHAAMLEELALAFDDRLNVLCVETSIVDDRLGDHLSRLVEGQSGERSDHALRLVTAEIDAYRLTCADAVDHTPDQLPQLLLIRKLQLEFDRECVEIGRQLDWIAGQNDHGARRDQLLSEIAQRAGDVRIREVRSEVFEEVNGVEVEAVHVLERHQRVLGHVHRRAAQTPQPICNRPFIERQAQIVRHLDQQRSDPLFLDGFDRQERMERQDERLQLVGRAVLGHCPECNAMTN